MLLNSQQVLGGRATLSQRRSAAGPVGRPGVAVAASRDEVPLSHMRDPEEKFYRYGPSFGGRKAIGEGWWSDAPRVRVRDSKSRVLDEFLELAVVNERLAGNLEPWEARQRLEYLRMHRKNWEHIYDNITKQDAVATLALIEEANEKVRRLHVCVCVRACTWECGRNSRV